MVFRYSNIQGKFKMIHGEYNDTGKIDVLKVVYVIYYIKSTLAFK